MEIYRLKYKGKTVWFTEKDHILDYIEANKIPYQGINLCVSKNKKKYIQISINYLYNDK